MEISLINKIKAVIGDGATVEHPKVEEFGDYSCNLLKLKLAEDEKQNIIKELEKIPEISKVELVNGGFLNIWLRNDYFVEYIERVLKDGIKSVTPLALEGKRVIVEYTDPNPFKEFHIGHLYSNIVGETICRLLEFQGNKVWRVCYQGDVGLHVAKSIWGMQNLSGEMPQESDSLKLKAEFMGKSYSLGATKYEEDPQIKEQINALNKKIYEQYSEIKNLYEIGKRWSLEYFETIYKRLGTQFKRYYFESEAGIVGKKLVLEYLDKGIFEKSQAAIIFPGEKYGLHTRVFINSMGLPTYEAKELGLAPTKYKDFPYDLSIIVTANEIDEYFKVLIKALEIVNPDLGKKTLHIGHGLVKLPEGKMSSRTGKIITGEWLLDEAAHKVQEISPGNPEADFIGIAAVKYALLKVGIGKDIEFNFNESVNFEGNSGPYLQYTYARTQSVLNKSGRVEDLPAGRQGGSSYQFNDEERAIVRWLYRFSEVVVEAAERYAPNLICTYLYELAQRFNSFYNKYSILTPSSITPLNPPLIIRGGNPEGEGDISQLRDFRLMLTAGVGEILKTGLNLLGIEALERM